MRILVLGLLMLAVAVAAASCGGVTVSDSGAIETGPVLNMTYASGDGKLAFNYPADWSIREESGQVLIGNSTAALEDTTSDATTTPGQFKAGISILQASRIQGLPLNPGPRDVLNRFTQSLSSQTPIAPADTTIGSRRAARAELSDNTGQVVLYTLEVQPGVYALITAGSARGELGSYEPTLLAIADSIRYSPRGDVLAPPAATEEAGS